MIVINLLLTGISAISLLFYPYFAANFQPMIWITVAIYGLGAAVMYPTMISWADQYTDMNEKFLTIIYNNV